MRFGYAVAALAFLAMASPAGAADSVKIGFINTFSGPQAIIGKHQRAGYDLAMEELGGKIGGLPATTVYGDDQVKPDVGRQVVDAMLKRDKVDFVVGEIWSNVLMAIRQPIVDSKTIMIITNAGASPMGGKLCSPYIFTTSWNNDQNAEATGKLMNDDHVDDVFIMAPNYQAGKDNVNGFKHNYKGKIKGEILFPINASDYQAELSQLRAAKPKALFIFAPGSMGIAFLKQWQASGLGQTVKLYTVFTVDYLTLPIIGEAALGSIHTNYWDPEGKFPANVKFVNDFKKKYGFMPSHFAAQAYDAPFLLDSAVKAVKGDLNNKMGLIKALEKANFASVRGPFTYNTNHVPIQNFYKREVERGPDGKPTIRTTGIVFADYKDSYYKECKMKY
jgi:branched-chain amino acid transport system substrate-binding protein